MILFNIFDSDLQYNMFNKFIFIQFSISLVLNILFCSFTNAQASQIVVIDAGHGGKDQGTTGLHSIEKDITLSLALKLQAELLASEPTIKVILTRDSDVFIPLSERTLIANRLQADLFISLHCNHVEHKSVHGTEVYIMGLSEIPENIEIAKRENSTLESDLRNPADFQDETSHIFMTMFQNNYLAESAELGKKIIHQLDSQTPLKQRGVKQAGFVVLKRATMPGVLVETAYLSHAKDEKYLLSEKGQHEIVSSISYAVAEYFDSQVIAQGDQYKVLLQESSEKEITSDQRWQYVNQFEIQQKNGKYQFTTGLFSDFSEVMKKRDYYISKGFKQALILKIEDKSQGE